MDKGYTAGEIKRFIKKRKKIFLVTFLVIFLAGIVTAISLPPIYRSESVIQVDEQQVPENFVQSTIDDYVDERIKKISQQVLSRQKLLEIIQQYGLYPEMKADSSDTEILAKIREDIAMENIVAEMKNKQSGKNFAVTLAFNLSYKGENPATVKQVTETLARLFLEEDQKRRQNMVSVTTDFLEVEQERLKNEIELHEKKIREFKEKHSRELPSDRDANIQAVGRLERDLDQAEMRIRFLEEKKLMLESKLLETEPLTPVLIEGDKMASNPYQRLKELYMQLTQLRSVYSDKHPDVKKMKREIAELEDKVQVSDVSKEKIKRLQYLETELASREAELGPSHPDIIALQKEIDRLSKEVDQLMTEKAKIQISEEKPDNPAYINLKTQISAVNMEIDANKRDQNEIIAEIGAYRRRIEKSPGIEKELNALVRDRELTQQKYNEISNKLMAAKLAGDLEGKQRGQRFSIATPAYLPAKPYKPNRRAIILIGLLVALGASFLLTAFQESLDKSIRDDDEIVKLTGAPVLSALSFTETKEEKGMRIFKNIFLLFVLISLGGLAIYGVDRYIVKINDLWPIIIERIQMIA